MRNYSFFKGVLYSVISALCFATLAVLIKVGYDANLTTLKMLFMRFFSAVVLFGSFLALFKREQLKISKSLLFKAFITGSVLYTTQAFCFFKAIQFTSPNVVELLLYIYPAFVSVLAFFFFKESFTFFKFVYIAVILIGFGFIFHDAFSSKIELKGVLFGFSAMIVYSFYLIVIQKFVKSENPFAFSFFTIFFAFVSFSVFTFVKEGVFVPNLTQMGVGLLLGLIPTFLAMLFLFVAIKEFGSALASIFSSVEPVFEIALSYLLLGIGLNMLQFVGGALILIGVFMANFYHLRESSGV